MNQILVFLCIFINCFISPIASDNKSKTIQFGKYQCSPLTNRSFQHAIGFAAKKAFEQIKFPNWAKYPSPLISCHQRGIQQIPKLLDPNVEILVFYGNLIRYVGADDLSRYRSLIALDLSVNCQTQTKIAQPQCAGHMEFHPLAFSRLTRLKYLDLNHNSMLTLPENLPPSLEVLVLSNTFMVPISEQQLSVLTSLDVVLLQSNCVQTKPVSLCPRKFIVTGKPFKYSKPRYLDISFNNLKSLPKFLFVESMECIVLTGNPIHQLDRDDFIVSPNLVYLGLGWTSSYDFLPLEIQSGSLDNLKRLEALDLSANMLTSLPKNFLAKNKALRSLYLSFNCFKFLTLNPTMVPSLPYLKKIYLAANNRCQNFSYYPTPPENEELMLGGAYQSFPALLTLSLGMTYDEKDVDKFAMYAIRYRKVTAQSFVALANLPYFKNLYLGGSGITQFDMRALDELIHLESIDLSYNEISSIYYSESRIEVKRKGNGTDLSVSGNYNNLITLHRNSIARLENRTFGASTFVTFLDLSNNKISYIGNNTFSSLCNLRSVNLSYNPIRMIFPLAFKRLSSVDIAIFGSFYDPDMSLEFLTAIKGQSYLKIGGGDSGIYHLLKWYLARNITFENVRKLDISGTAFPRFDSLRNDYTYAMFPRIVALTMQNALLRWRIGDNFFKGTPSITLLDLSRNGLEWFPYVALRELPNLTKLLLDRNFIQTLNTSLVWCCSQLEVLSIPHNMIRSVAPGSFNLPKLHYLDISFNKLEDLSPITYSKQLLTQLSLLDLRGNVMACHCSMSDNFGWLIRSGTFDHLYVKGFLPFCPNQMFEYFGGCLVCYTTDGKLETIFSYSLSYFCQTNMALLNLTIFFSINLVLFIVGSVGFSKWFKVIFAKMVHGNIRKRHERESIEETSAQNGNLDNGDTTYSYHGFVVYDTCNTPISDWLDDRLVGKLQGGNPPLRIGVIGQSDFCGPTPLNQLLLRMQASRKTIVIMSNGFGASRKCKYVISVLEDWAYSGTRDRCVMVNYEPGVGGSSFAKYRARKHPYSVVQYPGPGEDEEVFWEEMRTAILL